ncbi:hypothetical protein C5S35_03540 [Candidatus Methanophagaceae archaeon]|jgi:hypothetical protein|nr:hypothetical protein C5S35_03540 [Methanophagales archaeon]
MKDTITEFFFFSEEDFWDLNYAHPLSIKRNYLKSERILLTTKGGC